MASDSVLFLSEVLRHEHEAARSVVCGVEATSPGEEPTDRARLSSQLKICKDNK